MQMVKQASLAAGAGGQEGVGCVCARSWIVARCGLWLVGRRAALGTGARRGQLRQTRAGSEGRKGAGERNEGE